MRITANQVTLARIFLLPVPAYMLIYGEIVQWWIAFSLFVILGATDFVDGWMARREGPTRLGSLIDPVADKIFIAAILLSMVATGVFPAWVISVLLSRELLMTALRSSVAFRQEAIKTSRLAKLKTIVQMGGLGTIFLTITLAREALVIVSLALAIPFLAVAIYYLVVRKKMPFWALPVFASFVLVAAVGGFCTKEQNLWVQMAIIITITWASAVDYVVGSLKLFKRTGINNGDWVRIFWSIIYGVFVSPLVAYFPIMVLPLLVSMSLEFGLGGIDNVVVAEKRFLHSWPFIISSISGLLFSLIINYLIFTQKAEGALFLSLALALVSAINCSIVFIRNVELFKRGA